MYLCFSLNNCWFLCNKLVLFAQSASQQTLVRYFCFHLCNNVPLAPSTSTITLTEFNIVLHWVHPTACPDKPTLMPLPCCHSCHPPAPWRQTSGLVDFLYSWRPPMHFRILIPHLFNAWGTVLLQVQLCFYLSNLLQTRSLPWEVMYVISRCAISEASIRPGELGTRW